MGIYVEVKTSRGGDLIAWMEILREEKLRPNDEYGEYPYRFRYRGNTGRGVAGGGGVLHRRLNDVWDLIRSVLNHSEGQPEYCDRCHCQFMPATATEVLAEAESTEFYRKVRAQL